MLNQIDLRKLSEMTSPDRAFLSLYLNSPESMTHLEPNMNAIQNLLEGNKDELDQFRESRKMIIDYFDKNPYESGSMVIFSCWLLNYLEAIPLEVPVKDLIRVDSSPYIRPLAELMDEYENFAVVVADNRVARIFMVCSSITFEIEKIKGNIKNHVKVGGWSQQRYERRRDKELHLYVAEIIDRLAELDKEKEFNRIILVGSREVVVEIERALPAHLLEQLVGEKVLDLGKGEDYVNHEIFELFFEEETRAGKQLWDKIKGQYLKGELGVVAVEEVLKAAQAGRVERAIVNRDARITGYRCRDCDGLFLNASQVCPQCGTDSVFEVDMINEIVELLAETGSEMEFVDEIPGLTNVGNIAALLRY